MPDGVNRYLAALNAIKDDMRSACDHELSDARLCAHMPKIRVISQHFN